MVNISSIFSNFKSLNLFKKIFIIGFSIVILFFGFYSLIKIFQFDGNLLQTKILLIAGILITFIFFLYLSIYDIMKYEIPGKITVLFPVFLLLINILIGIVIGFNNNFNIWEGNSTSAFLNILGGMVGALTIGLIVFLTKEKGMGEGDIWVIASLGFFIGLEKLVIGFYLSIFSALFISIIYAIHLKRFKGVPIPFVPFLVFGCLTAFVLALDYRILFLPL